MLRDGLAGTANLSPGRYVHDWNDYQLNAKVSATAVARGSISCSP